MIPQETIDAIKAKADIVQVIGQYIKLEKKGADYKGLCPFHKDTHPSLSVSPSKRVFKCFSCGAAGDVIKFVQDYKHISYPEAIREVGKSCGIEVPLAPNKSARYQALSRYKDIMEKAVAFYEFCLNQTQEGEVARDYLHKRKLSDEVIKHFHIGCAPRAESLLTQHLSEQGVLPLDLIKIGLTRARDKEDGYYDVFRNRVMFPLDGLDGRIVGFSGRIYASVAEAKYINTAENELFHKGTLLYHYAEALSPAAQENRIYLFEGFMDVIACYRCGVLNAIASMGTALTREQIKAILKASKKVVIVYDGDAPGIAATKKAIGLFHAQGITPEACLFPDGMDPDEYINRYGAEALKNYLETKRESAIDYLYRVARIGKDFTKIESRDLFRREVFAFLHAFANPVYTAEILKRLEKDLEIKLEELEVMFSSEPAIDDAFKAPDFTTAPLAFAGSAAVPWEDVPFPGEERRAPVLKNKVTLAEERLIWFEYRDHDLALRIERSLGEIYGDFVLYEIRLALRAFYLHHDTLNPELLNMSLSVEARTRLASILESYPEIPVTDSFVSDLITCLKTWHEANIAASKATNNTAHASPEDDLAKLKAAAARKRHLTRVKGRDEGKFGK